MKYVCKWNRVYLVPGLLAILNLYFSTASYCIEPARNKREPGSKASLGKSVGRTGCEVGSGLEK